MHGPSTAQKTYPAARNLWIFNRNLDDIAFAHRLNESILEELLHEIESEDTPGCRSYWLAYARLAELALFLAGTYVDHGEVSAAGDLLVNPRHISVHLPGRRTPMAKERHTPLTEQFAHVAPGPVAVALWLARNARVRVQRQALLPHMQTRLQSSGFAADFYLRSLDARMKRAADGLAARCLHKTSTSSDKKPLRDRFCGFDLRMFKALGEELESKAFYLSTFPPASMHHPL